MTKLLVGALVLGMAATAGIVMAQQGTQNNPAQTTDLSHTKTTINNITNYGAVSGSTGTVSGSTTTIVGQPATVIHPAAAPTMKSVDRAVVPLPPLTKSTGKTTTTK